MSKFLIDGHTVTEELERLAAYGNQSFTASLHPGVSHVLGVRIPDLRKLARRIVKLDWEHYLEEVGTYYMEERILHGLVLGYIRPEDDVDLYLQRVSDFVRVINSWSVCDTFSFAGGKSYINKFQTQLWEFLKSWMSASGEYQIRFGVVMSLKYFIDKDHIDELFQCLDQISSDDYYAKMSVAWAVSVCFVKFPERTKAFLNHNHLDDFTYNMSLQKIIDSYRVEKSVKLFIKSLKRK